MRGMHARQSSRARGCLYFVLIDIDILGSITLARLHRCAGSSSPLLFANVILHKYLAQLYVEM